MHSHHEFGVLDTTVLWSFAIQVSQCTWRSLVLRKVCLFTRLSTRNHGLSVLASPSLTVSHKPLVGECSSLSHMQFSLLRHPILLHAAGLVE
jgi:hypothetical protein